jgi:hypothetical protein
MCWSVPSNGYDVENLSNHQYVEMKNKHNTMNSSSAQKTYIKMQNTLLNEQYFDESNLYDWYLIYLFV